MACLRKINDRQTPVSETQCTVDEMTFAIRPAMNDCIRHTLEVRKRSRRTSGIEIPRDSTHIESA